MHHAPCAGIERVAPVDHAAIVPDVQRGAFIELALSLTLLRRSPNLWASCSKPDEGFRTIRICCAAM